MSQHKNVPDMIKKVSILRIKPVNILIDPSVILVPAHKEATNRSRDI